MSAKWESNTLLFKQQLSAKCSSWWRGKEWNVKQINGFKRRPFRAKQMVLSFSWPKYIQDPREGQNKKRGKAGEGSDQFHGVKPFSHSAGQKIPRISWNVKVHCPVQNNSLSPTACATLRNILVTANLHLNIRLQDNQLSAVSDCIFISEDVPYRWAEGNWEECGKEQKEQEENI